MRASHLSRTDQDRAESFYFNAEGEMRPRKTLTFFLQVQETLNAVLPRGFVVMVDAPHPPHQLLHLLFRALKVIPRLQHTKTSKQIRRRRAEMHTLFPEETRRDSGSSRGAHDARGGLTAVPR